MATILQLDMEGNEILSSTGIASFANTRSEAKDLLGSTEKIGDYLLIADSINKRAIIYSTITNQITWEYTSDRYIVDFHLVPRETIIVKVGDGSIDPSQIYVRQNSTIVWENDSSIPIKILSGTTTYDSFLSNPDLSLFGNDFKSDTIQMGGQFSFKFSNNGNFDWFVYPNILTANITVESNQLFSDDQFIITETDNLNSTVSSRVIKVDSWGNTLWSFGESYLVKPRDARPLINNNVLIST